MFILIYFHAKVSILSTYRERKLGFLLEIASVRQKEFGAIRSHMKKDMDSQVVIELCLPTKSPTGLASLVSCYFSKHNTLISIRLSLLKVSRFAHIHSI
jgi:hypothetical protein